MKLIVRKTTFTTIVVFIVFALVASNGISNRKLRTNAQQLDSCSMSDSFTKRCTETAKLATSFLPPNSNLNLTQQQRFFKAVSNKLSTIPSPGSLEYILLSAYGAAFANQDPEIKLPAKVIFANEQEAQDFQKTLILDKVDGTSNCYLQKSAAAALNMAKSQVPIPLKSGYGTSDCMRTFATNLRFWKKYANHTTLERVRRGENRAILGVVAPPGASQHLWGLAVDLRVSNQAQRQALNQNGWFQTVENDVPHWTYVGSNEEILFQFGFKNKLVRGINYWVTPL